MGCFASYARGALMKTKDFVVSIGGRAMRADIALDRALTHSAESKGIEYARLWWRGVL